MHTSYEENIQISEPIEETNCSRVAFIDETQNSLQLVYVCAYSQDSFGNHLEGFMSLLFSDSPTHAHTLRIHNGAKLQFHKKIAH